MTGILSGRIAALLASVALIVIACGTPAQSQRPADPTVGGTPSPVGSSVPGASPSSTDDDEGSPGASDDDDDDDEGSPGASDDDDDDD